MKIKQYTPLLALLFTSGILHAQTTIPAGGPGAPGTLTAPLTIQGDTTVNGTLFVEPAVAVTANNNLDSAGQMNAVAGTNDGTSTAFRTVLGGAVATYETAGGAEIKNNGDTTLSASDGSTVTVTRVTETRIYNADQGVLAGQAVPNIQSYYLIDAAGNEIAGTRVSVDLLDPALDTAAEAQALFANKLVLDGGPEDFDFTSPAFAGVTVTVPTGTGGNLTVEGLSTTNGINNSGEKITNVADGTVATDAATVGQVAAADAALQAEIDAEEVARAAADTALQAEIDAEEIARAAADTAIRSEFAAADNVVRAEFAAADNVVRAEFAAADNVVRSEFAAADTLERNARIAADNALNGRVDQEIVDRIAGDNALGLRINDEQAARISADNAINIRIDNTNSFFTSEVGRLDNRITTETNARIAGDRALQAGIDENTRGIAMVAAMTNTRVEAGKTHGIDFNMAQYQSETGFAFGYANRINENLQIHGSLASTTDFDESVVRVGVAYQW